MSYLDQLNYDVLRRANSEQGCLALMKRIDQLVQIEAFETEWEYKKIAILAMSYRAALSGYVAKKIKYRRTLRNGVSDTKISDARKLMEDAQAEKNRLKDALSRLTARSSG